MRIDGNLGGEVQLCVNGWSAVSGGSGISGGAAGSVPGVGLDRAIGRHLANAIAVHDEQVASLVSGQARGRQKQGQQRVLAISCEAKS